MSRLKTNSLRHLDASADGVSLDNAGKVEIPKLNVGSDATGDLLYHNGTNYVRLAKGTASQVLTMNSGASAPEWAAAAGGGKLLQVQQTLYNTETSRGDDAWQDTGLTVNITPSSTSSHFLIHCHVNGIAVVGDDLNYARFKLVGSGSGVDVDKWFGKDIGLTQSADHEWTRLMGTASYTHYCDDQLNATDAVNFKVRWSGSSSSGDASYYGYGGSGAGASSIIVMEIAPND